MSAALQPQPAACATCGTPFAAPFCTHALTALAALTADPVELSSFDVFAEPEASRYSAADLRRGYCPTAAYYVVRRS